jgi:hypothetical protein
MCRRVPEQRTFDHTGAWIGSVPGWNTYKTGGIRSRVEDKPTRTRRE